MVRHSEEIQNFTGVFQIMLISLGICLRWGAPKVLAEHRLASMLIGKFKCPFSMKRAQVATAAGQRFGALDMMIG